MFHTNTCCDCKGIHTTAWHTTDEGQPGTHTAIRCCANCAVLRAEHGETVQAIHGDFEAAMRGIVRDLNR